MRNKKQRKENAASKSRGNCIEMYAVMSVEDAVKKGFDNVFVKVAGHEEGCRDIQDVKAVMVEQDIVGVIIPMRRAGDSIERALQTVADFVEPKGTANRSEAHAKKKEDG